MAGIGHRGFFGRSQGGICPSYTPGLYTAEEIDELVNVDGYIPVASAAEFDALRGTISQTMGAGTCWEALYTTGLDKKYVQVEAIDLSSFPSWTEIALYGIYDGNELDINNHAGDALFAFSTTEIPCVYKNIRDVGCNLTAKGSISDSVVDGSELDNIIVSGTVAATNGAGGIIDSVTNYNSNRTTLNNCHFSGTVTTSNQAVGGVMGIMTITTITNCTVTNTTLSGATGNVGGMVSQGLSGENIITDCNVNNAIISASGGGQSGFIGRNDSVIKISGCKVIGADLNFSGTRFAGGFIGLYNNVATSFIENCSVTGTIDQTSGNECGGFVGLNLGTIRECWCDIAVTGTNLYVGGFVGDNRAGTIISDCYSYGSASGASSVGGFAGRASGSISNSYSTGGASGSTNVGGFAGSVTGTNSQTACYWDTVTSGNATSAGAGVVGKTTAELQTPTSNTGIYSAWSLAVWSFGSSSDYPSLINTP